MFIIIWFVTNICIQAHDSRHLERDSSPSVRCKLVHWMDSHRSLLEYTGIYSNEIRSDWQHWSSKPEKGPLVEANTLKNCELIFSIFYFFEKTFMLTTDKFSCFRFFASEHAGETEKTKILSYGGTFPVWSLYGDLCRGSRVCFIDGILGTPTAGMVRF